MKTLSKPLASIVLAATSILISACASNQPAPATVSQLGAAGFRVHTPANAKQKEIFATLPAYKVESVMVHGRKFYVYKDEAKGLAMVGHEAEYERYRQLAHQDRMMAGHDMAMATSYETDSWYGVSSSDWWR
jgi:hypothetical protein